MTDDRDVRSDEQARNLFALRRLEQRSVAEVRRLDRRLHAFGEAQERSAHWLETEYRRTHFGKSPVSWPAHERSDR